MTVHNGLFQPGQRIGLAGGPGQHRLAAVGSGLHGPGQGQVLRAVVQLGREVLDKIRGSLPDVPMIALTGGPEEADAVARAVRHGPVAAIQKHGSLQSLREAVEGCLSRH